MYSKIQVIKMIREMVPEMDLKKAKDLVDEYELKTFENRVVSYMGADALDQLRTYARTFVYNENRKVNIPDTLPVPNYPSYVEGCTCTECVPNAEDDGVFDDSYDNYCCADCDGY